MHDWPDAEKMPKAERRDRLLEVGVGEDDVGRLAAELEGDELERRRRPAPRSACRSRSTPVKAILSTPGVVDERLARARAEARQHVDDARRQVELLDQRGERERRDRRVLRRLEHDRVAARERRAELPREHHQRRVPGDDRADHADRLAAGVGQERPGLRQRVTRARSGRRRRSTRSSARSSRARRAPRASPCRCRASRSARGASRLASISAAMRHSTRARSAARTRRQAPSNARRAAATAASTSAGPASLTRAQTSPVAGLTLSKTAPSAAGDQPPPSRAAAPPIRRRRRRAPPGPRRAHATLTAELGGLALDRREALEHGRVVPGDEHGAGLGRQRAHAARRPRTSPRGRRSRANGRSSSSSS